MMPADSIGGNSDVRQQILASETVRKSNGGRALLCQAVQQGKEEEVRRILDDGAADVNELSYYSGYGEPALITAVRFEHYGLVPLFLEYGADVNITTGRGHTALIRACQKNHSETAILLLKHGADPNVLDSSRLCALHWAVKNSNLELVKELLRYSADASVTIQQRSTVLHSACTTGRDDIVEALLSESGRSCINAVDEFGETPLFGAVRSNSFDVTSLLLRHNANVNAMNSDLRTPLYMAAASVYHSIDLTQLLLDNGALVNIQDRYGFSPLAVCLRGTFLKANFSVAKSLLQHGSNLNDKHCVEAFYWTLVTHANFDLIKLAVYAGFEPKGVKWVEDFINGKRTSFVHRNYDKDEEKDFIGFLKQKLSSASSLADICRVSVRRHLARVALGGSIYYRIQKLPLPQPVIMYLMFEE